MHSWTYRDSAQIDCGRRRARHSLILRRCWNCGLSNPWSSKRLILPYTKDNVRVNDEADRCSECNWYHKHNSVSRILYIVYTWGGDSLSSWTGHFTIGTLPWNEVGGNSMSESWSFIRFFPSFWFWCTRRWEERMLRIPFPFPFPIREGEKGPGAV